MSIRDYRDLIAWQKAIDLVEKAYRTAKRFPREELYGLTSQLHRAAVSVAANIAEGQGRQSTRDFLHFLAIAHGSLKELETHVFIAERLEYVNKKEQSELIALCEEVGRLISGLRNSLKKKQ